MPAYLSGASITVASPPKFEVDFVIVASLDVETREDSLCATRPLLKVVSMWGALYSIYYPHGSVTKFVAKCVDEFGG